MYEQSHGHVKVGTIRGGLRCSTTTSCYWAMERWPTCSHHFSSLQSSTSFRGTRHIISLSGSTRSFHGCRFTSMEVHGSRFTAIEVYMEDLLLLPWKLPWKSVGVDLLPWKSVEASMEIHVVCFHSRWKGKLPILPSIDCSFHEHIPWKLPWALIYPDILPPTSTNITNFRLLPQHFHKGPPTSVRSTSTKVSTNFHGNVHGSKFISM